MKSPGRAANTGSDKKEVNSMNDMKQTEELLKKHFQLLADIDNRLQERSAAREYILLAIEGGSASGKTTLGKLLEELYGCTVFHMDDFFLQPHQRTRQRLEEPGGNVDRERFLKEVLVPLKAGKPVTYQKFDCSTFSLGEPVTINPTKLCVVEGAYSMHPELAGYYDMSAFLDVCPDVQRKRIEKRNSPEMAERFFKEWIPMEQKYFDTFAIKEHCNRVFCVRE